MKRKIARPKVLIIGGKRYKVVEMEMEDWGEVCLDEQVIKIKKDISNEQYLDTLLHEILHIILHISGINYSLLKGDEDHQEGLVRAIENLYLPAIKPIIKKFL